MDRGTWQATVHRVTKSRIWLMLLSMYAWTVAWKALLSSTIFQNLLKFMATKTVVLSKHLLCQPLLLLPSISQHQGLFQWVSSSLQWVKWKSLSCVWLFVTPWTVVHGILQARILKWVAFPSPGDLPYPGIKPRSLHCRRILYQLSDKGRPGILEWVAYSFSDPGIEPGSPALQADSLPTELSGKWPKYWNFSFSNNISYEYSL